MNRFLALVLVLAVAACAIVRDVKPPTVELANIRLGEPGLLSQQFLMDLRVGNPNDFEVPLDGMTFELEINGRSFARGFSDAQETIPRLAYATVPVTASAGLLGVLRQLQALGRDEALSYRITGEAYIAGGLAPRTVSWVREGDLSLAPPPAPPQPDGSGVRTLVPGPGI